jgi:hypothetical protein
MSTPETIEDNRARAGDYSSCPDFGAIKEEIDAEALFAESVSNRLSRKRFVRVISRGV